MPSLGYFLALLGATCALLVHASSFDLMPMLQKISRVAPYLASQFNNEACGREFVRFKADIEQRASTAGLERPDAAMVKATFCTISPACVRIFARTFQGMFTKGDLSESVAREYFGGKGVDVNTLEKSILEQVDRICGTSIKASSSAEL